MFATTIAFRCGGEPVDRAEYLAGIKLSQVLPMLFDVGIEDAKLLPGFAVVPIGRTIRKPLDAVTHVREAMLRVGFPDPATQDVRHSCQALQEAFSVSGAQRSWVRTLIMLHDIFVITRGHVHGFASIVSHQDLSGLSVESRQRGLTEHLRFSLASKFAPGLDRTFLSAHASNQHSRAGVCRDVRHRRLRVGGTASRT